MEKQKHLKKKNLNKRIKLKKLGLPPGVDPNAVIFILDDANNGGANQGDPLAQNKRSKKEITG